MSHHEISTGSESEPRSSSVSPVTSSTKSTLSHHRTTCHRGLGRKHSTSGCAGWLLYHRRKLTVRRCVPAPSSTSRSPKRKLSKRQLPVGDNADRNYIVNQKATDRQANANDVIDGIQLATGGSSVAAVRYYQHDVTIEFGANDFLGIVICGSRPVRLQTVRRGGAARRAGLRVGDEILAADGRDLAGESTDAVAELFRSFAATASATTCSVALTVGRKLDQTVGRIHRRKPVVVSEYLRESAADVVSPGMIAARRHASGFRGQQAIDCPRRRVAIKQRRPDTGDSRHHDDTSRDQRPTSVDHCEAVAQSARNDGHYHRRRRRIGQLVTVVSSSSSTSSEESGNNIRANNASGVLTVLAEL